MRFRLFSKLSFEVSDPIALIESYCFQSDFYRNFDLIPLGARKIGHVNKIGARIGKKLLKDCEKFVTQQLATENLRIFRYNLDELLDLGVDERDCYIKLFNEKAIKGLLRIDGIGLSKATKILHSLYPETIPMIDNPLQDLYRKEINENWKEGEPEIFIDYYRNLKRDDNWKNLNNLSKIISKNKLGLTKVRIFDILWWSYLKAKRLKQTNNIKWSSIKW